MYFSCYINLFFYLIFMIIGHFLFNFLLFYAFALMYIAY